jgi:hypothetical protein
MLDYVPAFGPAWRTCDEFSGKYLCKYALRGRTAGAVLGRLKCQRSGFSGALFTIGFQVVPTVNHKSKWLLGGIALLGPCIGSCCGTEQGH